MLEERGFEDGEHKVRTLETVAGCDVYVVHSVQGGPAESPSDKLCRLLFFIRALKDAGAARVTAVTPYLCYARKDRRTKPNDPVTIRYVTMLFEAVCVDAVVTLEVHNEAAFENAFRCPSIALSTAPLPIDKIREIAADRAICVISPDLGGGKRADQLREAREKALGRGGQGICRIASQRRRCVTWPQPLAFQMQEGQFVQCVRCPQAGIKFETVDEGKGAVSQMCSGHRSPWPSRTSRR